MNPQTLMKSQHIESVILKIVHGDLRQGICPHALQQQS